MKEELSARFIVAAPECAKAKFEEILASIGFEPDVVCTSGEAAIREAQGVRALVLSAWKIEDMMGEELAERLGEDADVLMIVPGDYRDDDTACALPLYNPISPDALLQALRATAHMQEKLTVWQARARKAERTLEERKIVDRAKGRLMDECKMSEAQAHHLIQKRSMDQGRRIADVAREIMALETLDELAQA